MSLFNGKTLIAALTIALAAPVLADNQRDAIVRQMGVALVAGSCYVVLQKQYEITGATTTGTYLADNAKLHQCQYIEEVSSDHCVKAKNCQSYEQWSKAHPEFAPDLPRSIFVARLEQRQAAVRAIRVAANP